MSKHKIQQEIIDLYKATENVKNSFFYQNIFRSYKEPKGYVNHQNTCFKLAKLFYEFNSTLIDLLDIHLAL